MKFSVEILNGNIRLRQCWKKVSMSLPSLQLLQSTHSQQIFQPLNSEMRFFNLISSESQVWCWSENRKFSAQHTQNSPLSTISVSVALCSTSRILPNQPSPTIDTISNSSIKCTLVIKSGKKICINFVSFLFFSSSFSSLSIPRALQSIREMENWTTKQPVNKHLPSPIQIHVSCGCEGLIVSSLKIRSSTTTMNDSMTPSYVHSSDSSLFSFANVASLCWTFSLFEKIISFGRNHTFARRHSIWSTAAFYFNLEMNHEKLVQMREGSHSSGVGSAFCLLREATRTVIDVGKEKKCRPQWTFNKLRSKKSHLSLRANCRQSQISLLTFPRM